MNQKADHFEFISSQNGFEFGGKEYYSIITENHFWAWGRFQVFLARLKKAGLSLDEPLKGLDIGCGSGVVRHQIESSSPWTVDGTDLDVDGLRANKKGRGSLFFYDIMNRDARFKSHYDFLVLFDVLEHVEDTNSFLSACLYHLKPGGYIFVNVPALPFLYTGFDKVQGHYRRYTRKSLKNELDTAGLNILNIGYWGITMIPLLVLRKMCSFWKKISEDTYRRGITPPNRFFHAVLRFVLGCEIKMCSSSLWGSSVMAIVRKKESCS